MYSHCECRRMIGNNDADGNGSINFEESKNKKSCFLIPFSNSVLNALVEALSAFVFIFLLLLQKFWYWWRWGYAFYKYRIQVLLFLKGDKSYHRRLIEGFLFTKDKVVEYVSDCSYRKEYL